jgi:capsular polysaccharide transport system permease protein
MTRIEHPGEWSSHNGATLDLPVPPRKGNKWSRLKRWMSTRRYPLLIVVLPTVLVGFYLLFFAADQYQTEAHFVVRSGDSHSSSSAMMLQMLSPTSTSPSLAEQYSVGDYLVSSDAVRALQSKMDLVAMFRRPAADVVFMLDHAKPTDVELLKYYRRMVNVYLDTSTGVTTLKVRGFNANDTYTITNALLELGERRVNDFSKRAEEDTVKTAEADVTQSAKRVVDAQLALTQFRLHAQNIDPEKSITGQLTIVDQLNQDLAQSRAQLASVSSVISKDSPQYLALQRHIDAVQGEIQAQNDRLTGADTGVASTLSQYEQLLLAREVADREYSASLDSLKAARIEAIRQHLYVARVVEPNLPEEAEYPRSLLILISVFALLSVGYAIGWLILAGTREHAA